MEKLHYIELSQGKKMPIRCDLYVLSQLQDKYGTLEAFEYKLLGAVIEDGKVVRYSEPNISTILFALPVFIAEGAACEKEMNGKDIENFSQMDIIRTVTKDYRLIAYELHEEMKRCFTVKKRQRRKH